MGLKNSGFMLVGNAARVATWLRGRDKVQTQHQGYPRVFCRNRTNHSYLSRHSFSLNTLLGLPAHVHEAASWTFAKLLRALVCEVDLEL